MNSVGRNGTERNETELRPWPYCCIAKQGEASLCAGFEPATTAVIRTCNDGVSAVCWSLERATFSLCRGQFQDPFICLQSEKGNKKHAVYNIIELSLHIIPQKIMM
jgi:hypothetical protein